LRSGRLQTLGAGMADSQLRDAGRIRLLAAHLRSGHGLVRLPVEDLHVEEPPRMGAARADELEDVLLVEQVVRPENLLAGRDLELAAAHLERLPLHVDAPELRIRRLVRSDPRND